MEFLLAKNKARKITCTEVVFRWNNCGKTFCKYHYDSYTDQERDLFHKNETSTTFRNVSQKIANRHENATVFYSRNTALFSHFYAVLFINMK